jgi:hypothetical protein
MTNLLERAISTDDADRAAKIIQNAWHRERRSRQLLLSKELAQRP